jgi:hypothetical protein
LSELTKKWITNEKNAQMTNAVHISFEVAPQ